MRTEFKKRRFIDPFTPNRPITDPDRFFGREESVDNIVNFLYQIKNNNPTHTIITGKRGVGKSSLLSQIELTAQGDLKLLNRLNIDTEGCPFNFITVRVDAHSEQNLNSIVNSISNGILENLRANNFLEQIKKLKNNFLENINNRDIEVAGILSVGASHKKETSIDLSYLVDNFVDLIDEISKKISSDSDGIIIFIDEIDRIPLESGISSFFKLTCERLSKINRNNVAFICAGITGAVQNMMKEHESILRTFRDVPLLEFNSTETKNILANGFKSVGFDHKLDNFIDKIEEVTNGLPELIHLVGSRMLSVDTNQIIEEDDFNLAVKRIVNLDKRNNLEHLIRKSGSGNTYKKILLAIANYDKKVVPFSHIEAATEKEQSQLSPHIGNLIKREIIERKDRGKYCFTEPLLKEYIKIFGLDLDDEDDESDGIN